MTRLMILIGLGSALLACGADVGTVREGQDATTVCGGLRGAQCSADAYCDFEPDAMCGAADATGVCRPRPQVCTAQIQPVVGCNGHHYGNDCEAHRDGTDDAARECGGFLGISCKADELCNYTPDECGIADQSGVCEPRPEVCTDVYDPVTGCDGNVYGNACEAARAGQDVNAGVRR